MKLIEFSIKNFRGFGEDSETLVIDDLTTLVGKNDSGKSSIIDAMNIFFNGYKNIDSDDFHLDHEKKPNRDIELRAKFSVAEDEINKFKIETVNVDLKREGLLDHDNNLTIVQYINAATKAGIKTSMVVNIPSKLQNIHSLRNRDLKKIFDETASQSGNVEEWSKINHSINTDMRTKLISYFRETDDDIPFEISIDKEGGKDIWASVNSQLPMYQVFRADRNNTDADSEIQDPLKAITKKTIHGDLQDRLNLIAAEIKQKAEEQARLTLSKLNEMDPTLAEQITPTFNDPNWESVFKFSLETDQIPLNKRGSGTRRLILLNFFRAQAEEDAENQDSESIIYAFEEPETAQHPDHQKMLMDAFKKISKKKNQQVIITTHSPELGGEAGSESIRYVSQSDSNSKIDNEPELIEVSKDLGILPNVSGLPGRVHMVIFVEGPNDVKFVKYFVKNSCPDIWSRNDILVIPFGGGALKHWLDLNILSEFTYKRFYIFDKDSAGDDYVRQVERTEKDTCIHQWSLGPIEFYFPFKTYLEAAQNINISRKKGDNSPELNLLSEDQYHNANYKLEIEPVKKTLWSNFDKITQDGSLLNYLKTDQTIYTELSHLKEQLNEQYSC